MNQLEPGPTRGLSGHAQLWALRSSQLEGLRGHRGSLRTTGSQAWGALSCLGGWALHWQAGLRGWRILLHPATLSTAPDLNNVHAYFAPFLED